MAIESLRPFVPPTFSAALKAPDLAGQPPRIPTGVPDFDYLTGGVPSGSVILLLGEAGAGHQEFALTSAVHLMLRYDDPALHRFYLGSAKGPFVYPEGVAYISTSRSREQVLNEVRGSFAGIYPEILVRHLTFHDLSPAYFRDTVVPTAWSSLPPSPLLGDATGRTRPVTALWSRGRVDRLERPEQPGRGRFPHGPARAPWRGVERCAHAPQGPSPTGEGMERAGLPAADAGGRVAGHGAGSDGLRRRRSSLPLDGRSEQLAPSAVDDNTEVHARALADPGGVPGAVRDPGERVERARDHTV